jgi:type I restriction enzyme S subunit
MTLSIQTAAWTTFRIKDLVSINPTTNFKRLTTLDFFPMSAIGYGSPLRFGETKPVDESAGYSGIRNGDVVYAKVTPCFENGKAALVSAISADVGIATTEITCLRPRSSAIDANFLLYRIKAYDFMSMGRTEMKGAGGLKRVPERCAADFAISLPALPEQIAIAAYLDKATATIDKQRALLERKKALVQQHKKVVIHEAVTKGLNPGVPMKPSGVRWIGDVPAHWTMQRLKDCLYERGEKNAKPNGSPVTDNILSVMKDRGVINYRDKGNVGNKMSDDISGYKLVHAGDLVVNKMNILIGSFGISPEYGALSVVYLVLRSRNSHMPFLGNVFGVKNFQLHLRGIAKGILEIREAVDMDLFWQEQIPNPPFAEQHAIASHISKVSSSLDRQCELIDRKIELLGKLRESTIHEAVTKGIPAGAV